jgi:omega-6 fatty acid desaturase (delta-12 desaturase)
LVSIDVIKQHKLTMQSRYGKSDDLKGSAQFLTTLLAVALLWYVAVRYATVSYLIVAVAIPLITMFLLRGFAMMHECGHGSLFRSRRLNRAAGFALGVLSGMPQYVWARHHAYHHVTNGDWERYRGPYTTLSVDEYASLSSRQQFMYRFKRSTAMAPVAGFIYLIFNPRLTWMLGTVGLLVHVLRLKLAQPSVPLKQHAASYKTRYWKTEREYWHMTWNNVVLLSAWALLCWACGSALFFTIYLLSLSMAGALGIMLFTVQHNFEHSYATNTARWDHDMGAIKGTSYLVLPGWLNWFTINMGYHHVHHLCANIPNYQLARCHNDFAHLFPDVTRLRLSGILHAWRCILWDTRAQRIISVAEYESDRAVRGRGCQEIEVPAGNGTL